MRLPIPLTLQTRVGRRIALLFVVSALLPVAALAVVGYRQVRSQLLAQAAEQLEQAAKNVGMGLIDQLNSAANTLTTVSAGLDRHGTAESAMPDSLARATFSSFAVVDGAGTRVLWGAAPGVTLSEAATRWIRAGHTTLRVDSLGPQVWLVVRLDGERLAWASLSLAHLFLGAAERARVGIADTRTVVRDTAAGVTLLSQRRTTTGDEATARWELFLGFRFGATPWSVEVAEPVAAVLEPVAAFRRTFVFSIIFVLGLVVLLSTGQVRRTLQPLAALKDGTRRLAQRDFSGTVRVSSGDEFEKLATSFNTMAAEIDQHFRTMMAINLIDQEALAARRAHEVAATAAAQFCDVLSCPWVEVFVAGERAEDAWARVRAVDGVVRNTTAVSPATADLDRLRATGPWLIDPDRGFDWLGESPTGGLAVLPLLSHGELLGLIALRGRDGPLPEDRLRVARQLGDQLAVALSHSRLLVRLNELSYGALSALASTIDANSAWTAGHSERVASLSLRIGSRLGLPADDMDTLHRAGLLHDIGKVGVPSHLVDFAGVLTPEERAIMQEHPVTGARILSPIAAFAKAVPIVLHHHECVDGSGYPGKLRGDDIPFLARVLAVADVYDALVWTGRIGPVGRRRAPSRRSRRSVAGSSIRPSSMPSLR